MAGSEDPLTQKIGGVCLGMIGRTDRLCLGCRFKTPSTQSHWKKYDSFYTAIIQIILVFHLIIVICWVFCFFTSKQSKMYSAQESMNDTFLWNFFNSSQKFLIVFKNSWEIVVKLSSLVSATETFWKAECCWGLILRGISWLFIGLQTDIRCNSDFLWLNRCTVNKCSCSCSQCHSTETTIPQKWIKMTICTEFQTTWM